MTDVRAAVATQRDATEEQKKRLARQRDYIERMAPELRRVMGSQAQTDRLVRIAISAARSSETMTRATPLSLAGSLMTAAVLDLEVNTPLQEAYLLPYENRKVGRGPDGEFPVEAQLIIGYQGFIKLYRQHPMAGDIYAEAVYQEDDFHYARGTSPYIHHVPKPEARASGSEPTHYYAVAILANRATPFVVLTAAEVKTLRRGKVGPSGDIPDPQRWMERKVALKQLTKLLPKSTVLALATEADEQMGSGLYMERVKADRADGPLDVDMATGELLGPVEDQPPGGEDS